MQEKSESFGEFATRTDRLAAHLGVTVSDLTDVIHLSNGMLFAYRKGKHPISAKAWSKLEAAEVKAGVRSPPVDLVSLVELPEPQELELFIRQNPAEATALMMRLLEAQKASSHMLIQIKSYRKKPSTADEAIDSILAKREEEKRQGPAGRERSA